MNEAIAILAYLIGWHFIADYPLQGDFLSRAKNPCEPLPSVPWWQAMMAHCAIHAVGVLAITGALWLALAEFVIHWATDYVKCCKGITFNQDQAVHIATKVALVVVWWAS